MGHRATVSNWIVRLGNGDEDAIETMFSRYFERLIHLAVRKMHGLNQVPRSGEDIAISAVKSFCNALKEKKLDVASEDDLWACLFRITTRKACAERRRAYAAKRGENIQALRSDLVSEDEANSFLEVAGREPSPELALEMAENADELLLLFDNQPVQKEIISLKLQGFSNQEIAQQMGLVLRTIFWHLKKIQSKWNFFKSMEYLTENLFAGFSPEYLADALDWNRNSVITLIHRLLDFWESETQNPNEKQLLAMKFFTPEEFTQCLAANNPEAFRIQKNSEKIADYWLRHIKTDWRPELQRFVEKI